MPIKTQDIFELTERSGNLYESVVICSKRARQIATRVKSELDEKLQYFEGFEADLDDTRMSEEQARISLEFETRPKASEVALDEMANNEIYFRRPTDDIESTLNQG